MIYDIIVHKIKRIIFQDFAITTIINHIFFYEDITDEISEDSKIDANKHKSQEC